MTHARPLTALTFDLDDTLWDNGQVMAHTETGHYAWLDAALTTWHGARLGTLGRFGERFPLTAYQQRRGELATRNPLRRGDFTWIRQQSLYELLIEYGLEAAEARRWATAAMEEFMTLRHRLTPYPEVEPLLTRLGTQFRLAAVTNGNVDLDRLPLAHHFPVRIAAGELQAPKPDARPFLAALSRLQATPAQALHVGDSWDEDVLPAQRLGMRVAWIDKRDVGLPASLSGVYRLTHVRELQALIERLATGDR
ncbi:HAD family hydrolase [Halomonas sp. YLGW01]|uniref:HAD family hydrolase n=1 Tax=Halomonas sp. YLGW01 TaxID=2773308 RepID=UPI0017862542|nr:HAD family hydrolase [Halomonas sp. YLGW01]